MSLLARAPRQVALRTRLNAPMRFAHGHGEYKVCVCYCEMTFHSNAVTAPAF